nr:TOBE domain-containing protein [uncultured Campylobacter sp.]
MAISARNQLNVVITEVKTGAVNSLIVGKTKGGDVLKATVTTDSEKGLDLKAGKEAVFLFKAPSVIISKGENDLRLSATNQIKGKITAVKEGAVNAEISVRSAGGENLSAIVTNSSVKNLALAVGDEVTAIIKATQIIVGVK